MRTDIACNKCGGHLTFIYSRDRLGCEYCGASRRPTTREWMSLTGLPAHSRGRDS